MILKYDSHYCPPFTLVNHHVIWQLKQNVHTIVHYILARLFSVSTWYDHILLLFQIKSVTSQGTRTATTSRSGNQCCYDFGGNLIPPGKLGAGTVDLVSPEVSKWDHFLADVLPAIACCWAVFADCSSYTKHRPVGDCSGYQPPPPGNTSILCI